MMVPPSLSTSISSPSFFKDRENEGEEEEEEEEEELGNAGEEEGQQQQQDVTLESTGEFGNLGEFNASHLLDSLNQITDDNNPEKLNDTSNQNLEDLLVNTNNIGGLLEELDKQSQKGSGSVGGASSRGGSSTTSRNTSRATSKNSSVKSNKKGSAAGNLKSSGTSSPKERSIRIYRTFPYRGNALPPPIFEILNSFEISTNDIPILQQQQGTESKDQKEEDTEKPKPCSTNGIRHSRQYKGLNQLFDEISKEASKNELLASSFFEPPASTTTIPNSTAAADNSSVPGDNDSESQNPTPSVNINDLMQSLNGSQLEEQKLFSTSFDDMKMDLNVDGIQFGDDSGNTTTGSSHNHEEMDKLLSNLNNIQDLLPQDILTPTSSSSLPSSPTTSTVNLLPMMNTTPTSPSSTTGTPSTNSSPSVQSPTSRAKDKKQQLSRTITFSDPSSILNFFSTSSNTSGSTEPLPIPPSKHTTTTTTSGAPGGEPPLSPSSSNSKVSLQTLFPKISFNDPSKTPTLSPSKFYFPLLQPHNSTQLIRGYGVKADMNKKGLLRAKKVIDMEDVYYHEYPFGGGDQYPQEKMALFAIFDGHSGKNAAVAAKEILSEVLLKYIRAAQRENSGRPLTDMRGVFLGTFKEIDAKLSKFEYEGTTATVVLIWRAGEQRFLQSANVGDSTAFLSYAGETLLITKDHRVTDPEEIQRIKSEGVEMTKGQTRINGLMVSRALGDHFIKHNNCGLSGEPYISPPINLTPFHTHLIIASDGLWDVILGHKAMDIIKLERDEEKMASALLKCSVDSLKSKDNISIIVVTL